MKVYLLDNKAKKLNELFFPFDSAFLFSTAADTTTLPKELNMISIIPNDFSMKEDLKVWQGQKSQMQECSFMRTWFLQIIINEKNKDVEI